MKYTLRCLPYTAIGVCMVGYGITVDWPWLAGMIAIGAAVGWKDRRHRKAAARQQLVLAELVTREHLRVPRGYPEYLTASIGRKHDRQLAALGLELWPHAEYRHIVREHRDQR